MKAMAAELNMLQAQVNEYRFELERITRELQDVKVSLSSPSICVCFSSLRRSCFLLRFLRPSFFFPSATSVFHASPLNHCFDLMQRKYLDAKKKESQKDRDPHDPLLAQQQSFHISQPRIAGGGFNLSASAYNQAPSWNAGPQQPQQPYSTANQQPLPSSDYVNYPMPTSPPPPMSVNNYINPE